MNDQPPTLVVGAGLAGLTCAKTLHEAGRTVVVLEKENAVGGRVRTDEVDGHLCDRGFQVLLTAYPEAQRHLNYERLGLRPFTPGTLIRKGGRFHRFVDPWRRPIEGVKSLFNGLGTFSDRLRMAKLRRDSRRGKLVDLFDRPESTSLQSLQDRGFSNEMVNGFFRPFLGGVFLEPQLKTSSRMLEFVFRMFSSGDIAIPATGMQAIPNQLAACLPDDWCNWETKSRRFRATASNSMTAANSPLAGSCLPPVPM